MRIYKLAASLLLLYLTPVIATPPSNIPINLVSTTAKLELTTDIFNEKVLSSEQSIVGVLIRESCAGHEAGKTYRDFLEKDGKSLIIFTIAYNAPITKNNETKPKVRTIIQHGLFRAIPNEAQQVIETQKPKDIKVVYQSDNPIDCAFVINGKSVSMPPLLTKTIDNKWKK